MGLPFEDGIVREREVCMALARIRCGLRDMGVGSRIHDREPGGTSAFLYSLFQLYLDPSPRESMTNTLF